MSTLTIAIFIIIAFAFGLLIGGLAFNQLGREPKKQRDLEKHLHQEQEDFKGYRQQVQQHFGETSHLLKQLAENYRNVHNHLAQGANDLCNENPYQPIIKKLPEMNAIEVNEEPSNVQAPLDYAPKSTPYDKGSLSEEYGLEKVNVDEPITDDLIAEAIAEQAKKQQA